MIPVAAGVAVGAIAKLIMDRVLFFLAIKALLTVLFITVVPIIFNNLIYEFMDIGMDYVNLHAGNVNGYETILDATGFLAWFCECVKLPECVSIMVSALQLHIILKMIPFSPVK